MEEIEGSEQILDADLVLIAAGFLGAQAYVTDAFGVETTPRTNVSTKIGHYSTSVEKVFTAGDMHRGQSLVVWAIREGRDQSELMLWKYCIQSACGIFVQSTEKSDCASYAQVLCSASLLF